ncbi:MAG: poly(A) polymerase [Phycisphaerae bacterium]
MNPPSAVAAAAGRIVRALKDAGHQALWAGGCVRDMLLGREPSDIDIATSATPEQIMALFKPTRKVGVQFGVVLVRKAGHWFEVATFRRDVNYADGRRPEQVVFTDAREDALRRDFTINGLFYDPITGQVIDYVGGQEDLRAGLVRAIGDPAQRFAEDHLRLLRAARFAARLGFQIEASTAEAVRAHAADLVRISPERIREELEKMLAHPARARAFALMADLNLLMHLWPRAEWSDRQIEVCRRVLTELPPSCGFIPALAALLHDRSAEHVQHVTRALRCSNHEIALARWLVQQQARMPDFAAFTPADARKIRAHPGFDDLLLIHRAVCTATGRPRTGLAAAERLRDALTADQATPPPFITGEDLIDKGLKPGPRFKDILNRLYDAQLNGQLTSRDAALKQLQQYL